MKINLTTFISRIGQDLKSTFQLLLYLNKHIPSFSKKKPTEKKEPTVAPVNEQEKAPPPSDEQKTSPPKKRGRPSKKTTKAESPEENIETEGPFVSIDRANKITPEDLPETTIIVEGTEPALPSKKKRWKIAVITVLFFICAGLAEVYLYPHKEDPTLQPAPTEPKTLVAQPIPGSLQPPLNTANLKGFMTTVNPQFLMDKPQTDDPIPRVCIILYNVGNSEADHEEMDISNLNLPEDISFAVSPYANDLKELILDIKNLGHIALLQMPWEDDSLYEDQGNLTVLTHQHEDQLFANLKDLKDLSEETSGFFVHKGATLLRHPKDLNSTLHFIAKNKNMLIAPPDTLMTNLHASASNNKLNYACITLIEPKSSDIKAITALAQRTGFVILAFPLKKNVVSRINDWIKIIEEAKLSLVPISEILPLSETKQ